MGLTSRETNGDIASNVEVAVAKGAPDASLALLAHTLSSCSCDEVGLSDPARLEAGIVSQLCIGTTISPVRNDYDPPLVRECLVRNLSSSSVCAMSSPSLASIACLLV